MVKPGIERCYSCEESSLQSLALERSRILFAFAIRWALSLGNVVRVRCLRTPATGSSDVCVRVGGIKSQPFTVARGCWIPTKVCVFTTLLHSLYELDRQSQPRERERQCWKLQDQLFAFCGQFATACIFLTGFSTCVWVFFSYVRPSVNTN